MRKPFNSRPHKEVDLSSSLSFAAISSFQFTTSQGGRPMHLRQCQAHSPFNSRPHKEVDPELADRKAVECSFNSRPHKEVDEILPPAPHSVFILSIHDLTRRSTAILQYSAKSCLSFNSRPHKEVDVKLLTVCRLPLVLSIHDLTRRSTSGIYPEKHHIYLSIHDLTRRSTLIMNYCRLM